MNALPRGRQKSSGKAFSRPKSHRSVIPDGRGGLVAQDASFCKGPAGTRDLSDR